MTDDLVKRLREFEGWDVFGRPNFVICDEAANRIERLERALLQCVDAIREYELGDRRPERTPRPDIRPWLLGAMDHARIVLEEKPND